MGCIDRLLDAKMNVQSSGEAAGGGFSPWGRFELKADALGAHESEDRSADSPVEGTDVASVDHNHISSELEARGFGCDLWFDPPGRRWEEFRHATDEVVVVIEGEMEFEIAGEVHRPAVGEEVFIPSGTVHSARNVGETTARWLYGYRRRR